MPQPDRAKAFHLYDVTAAPRRVTFCPASAATINNYDDAALHLEVALMFKAAERIRRARILEETSR